MKKANLLSYVLGIGALLLSLSGLLVPYFDSRSLTSISSVLYSFLGQHCHQMPERSLWVFGSPMGLCSRCFALYSAVAVTAFSLAWIKDQGRYWKTGFLLVLPIIFDGSTQLFSLRTSTGSLRIITGILAGIGLALVLRRIMLISVKRLVSSLFKAIDFKNAHLLVPVLILAFVFMSTVLKSPTWVYSQTAGHIILKQYTPVILVLREDVSTRHKKAGDSVQLAVAEDVVVEREILIKAGTSVMGKLSVAKKPGRLGEAGEIALVPRSVEAVDGQKIRLGGTLYARGEDKELSTGVLTAICFPFALRRGGTASVIDGAELKAYVERDYEIKVGN